MTDPYSRSQNAPYFILRRGGEAGTFVIASCPERVNADLIVKALNAQASLTEFGKILKAEDEPWTLLGAFAKAMRESGGGGSVNSEPGLPRT